MKRDFLTLYLITVECYPDANNDVPGVYQLWRNDINGLSALVPYEDELSLMTYCRIFYDLKVDPPKEKGYDSDYAVFISFIDTKEL